MICLKNGLISWEYHHVIRTGFPYLSSQDMNPDIILLIPSKADTETQQVADAWAKQGGKFQRLDRYWVKDISLENKPLAVYGNQVFCLVLAQIYNLQLISSDDSQIASVATKWTKRDIRLTRIRQITREIFPRFIKPVTPKLFVSGTFNRHEDFLSATHDINVNEMVLSSSVIDDIEAEARAYVLEGKIMDIAFYEGQANMDAGTKFLHSFLADPANNIPSPVVIDIAYSRKAGWFIIEFNSCWGAGLNNCNADKIIRCVINATNNDTHTR